MNSDTQEWRIKKLKESLDGVLYHSTGTGNNRQVLMQTGGALRLEAGRRQEDEAGAICNSEARSSGDTRG